MVPEFLLLVETSIIQSAAFEAGFLEIILNFKECQNAPFLEKFLSIVKIKLIRFI